MDVRRIVGVACRSAALLSLVILGALPGCETGTSEKDINESVVFTLADVRQAMLEREADPEAAILIDPRATKYYEAARLPGAVNLRLQDVREDDPRDRDLERYDRLIVYGDNPGSAVARAMFKRLLAVGYDGVRLYAGGVDEWLLSGGRIESDLPPEAAEETAPPPEVSEQ